MGDFFLQVIQVAIFANVSTLSWAGWHYKRCVGFIFDGELVVVMLLGQPGKM